MEKLNNYSELSISFSLISTLMSKRIDIDLSSHGISFSEFMILYFLDNSREKMMRRIDLASKAGLSASGVTRLVSPMERTGLVEKKANKRDARVSLVKITESGSRILKEASVTMNGISAEIFSSLTDKKTEELLKMLSKIGGTL